MANQNEDIEIVDPDHDETKAVLAKVKKAIKAVRGVHGDVEVCDEKVAGLAGLKPFEHGHVNEELQNFGGPARGGDGNGMGPDKQEKPRGWGRPASNLPGTGTVEKPSGYGGMRKLNSPIKSVRTESRALRDILPLQEKKKEKGKGDEDVEGKKVKD